MNDEERPLSPNNSGIFGLIIIPLLGMELVVSYPTRKQGVVNSLFDLLIAAHALRRELVLVTNNEKEFKRINNLKAEN